MSNSHWEEPKEIKIPVSYGYIAAKIWGNEHSDPVLALHGYKDNAGTFDRLIPLLTSNLQIVALDTPGNGLSSHKPPGSFYFLMEILLDIKRVVNYLKWDRFSFLGHSLGGAFALMYGSVFPESVKNIVLLDAVALGTQSAGHLPDITRAGIERLLSVEKKMLGEIPVYTMDEARARSISGRWNGINVEGADILLKRGCIPSSDGRGVIFSRDVRHEAMAEIYRNHSIVDIKAYMRRIKCNMLILLADNSLATLFKPRVLKAEDFLDIFKENCQSLNVVTVEGGHFVHLNNPECVAPYINSFFNERSISKI